MNKIMSVLQVIVPLITCIALGIIAKKKNILTSEQNRGIQQFVLKFCIPCVLFNSCLQARLGPEAIISMGILIPMLLLCSFLGFRLRRGSYPFHNLPMLFSAHETGMLGIPLFMLLFGADQAYRMGLLDMTQAFIAIPVITLLSADTGKGASPKEILVKVFSSPLLIMSLLGFALGLSGIMDRLNALGIGPVITETTSFMAQPVSAAMLFSIGFNFSLKGENSGRILRMAAILALVSLLSCLVMQAALCIVPSADVNTRWAALLYCALPASFIAPGLGKNEEEYSFASGVCSVLTVLTLIVFCVMAVIAA